jgi:hypothetical protein
LEGRRLLAIDLDPLIDGREEICRVADSLREARDKIPVGPQRIVEEPYGGDLETGAEVDEQVSAQDHVEPGERRVFDHILPRKDAHAANRSRNLITAVTRTK